MHPNPIYRKAANADNLAFVRNRAFGTLGVNGDAGPLLAHIPFLLSEDGRKVEFHLVRSNPIARLTAQPLSAVLSVSGPDSYISPDWYDVDDQVPTWNYVAVHLRGTLVQRPVSELRQHLDQLSHQFESRLSPKTPWKTDKMDAESLDKMMRMILPFRVNIDDVQSTWKLAQNKPDKARISAANQVETNGIGLEITDLAGLMRSQTKT